MTPEPPAEAAPVPISLLGLPEPDPEVCEISAGVDRRGVVRADLTSDDPRVVEGV